jgi:hypothetical protein
MQVADVNTTTPRARGPLDDDPEVQALLAEARRTSATAFPNLDRTGCPAEEILEACVRSGRLPSPELRTHLLTCSSCFQHFRTLKAAHATGDTAASVTAVSASAVSSRSGFLAWGHLGWIGGLAACLLLASGAWLAWDQRWLLPRSATPAAVQSAAPASARHQGVPVVATALNDHTVFRGDPGAVAQTTSAPTQLPRGIVDVDLLLPAGDPAPTDLHSVALVDAFDAPVAPAISLSAKAATLRVRFDLSAIAPGRYSLRVSRHDFPPRYAPVVIHQDQNRNQDRSRPR